MKDKLTLLATAIGSLPYDNPEQALSLIFDKFPQFPVWPQLSKVNPKEDMTAQFTQKIPGVIFDEAENRWFIDAESKNFYEELEEFYLDYDEIVNNNNFDLLDKYAITGEFTSVIPTFLEKIKETQPAAIKGQITGPFTYGTSLVDRSFKCAFYDDTLKEIIIKALTLKALWQVKEYKKACPESTPVIFMDEPSVSQYGTSAFITVKREDVVSCLAEIAEILQKNGAIVGIHCCGNTDWSLITESGANMLNFDAFDFAHTLGLYADQIKEFLNKGGYIAWGLIPTLDENALANCDINILTEKFDKARAYLTDKGIDEELIIKQSVFTPTCGAGGLSIELAEKAISLASDFGKTMSERYL